MKTPEREDSNAGLEGGSGIRRARGRSGDDQGAASRPPPCRGGGPLPAVALTWLSPNTCSPRGVCQPSGSASSDFSEQQLGFSPSSGPSCHHPQGSGGKVVVRWDAEAPPRPSSARSLHPALLVECHRVRCSHSSACCSISRGTVAPRRGSTSHELWLG